MAPSLALSVLGPLQVTVDGTPVRLGDRAGALVVALTVRAGEVVTRDALVELLWPDERPADDANALQVLVSRVRRSLGVAAGALVTRGPGYVLDVPDLAIDAQRFEHQVVEARAAARRGGFPEPSALGSALAMWRGDPYVDAPDDPAAVAAASRLAELRREAVELRAEAVLAHGGGPELVPDLQAAVRASPDRERTVRALASSLYRAGRQAEALDELARLRTILRDEHGLDPDPATVALQDAILARAPELDAPPPPETPTDVPPSHRSSTMRPLPVPRTSFVGRRTELAAIRTALGSARLVTLVGAGGTGKTRLAIQALRDLPIEPAGGIAFVDLAPVGDPADVLAQVAAGLGVDPELATNVRGSVQRVRSLAERLRDRVRDDQLVVLVDNCEHVADAAAETIDLLLDAGDEVRVLATSREALRVDGERLLPVAPLGVPPADVAERAPEEVLEHDAVRLFVERARVAAPDLTIDPTTAPAIVQICRRLDGLPLALELAAARTTTLPVATLAERLGDRFQLLTGGRRGVRRQQTLDAVVAWSYDLLDDRQRRLLRRLGTFAGTVEVDLVVAVVADRAGDPARDLPPSAVLPVLLELADRSLVALVDRPPLVDDPTTAPRVAVELLETIRAFAQERLVREEDAALLRRRHAEALLAEAADAAIGVRGAGQLRWLDRLERDHDELRAALGWWLETEPQQALRMAADLAWFWWLHDHHLDAARWLRRGLERARQHADAELRMLGHAWLALMVMFDNKIEETARATADARELLRALPADHTWSDPFARAAVPLLLAYLEVMIGDPEVAGDGIERAVEEATAIGEDWVVAAGCALLAGYAVTLRRGDRVERDAARALAAAARVGDRWATLQTRTLLGLHHLGAGRYDRAAAELAAARPLAQAMGSLAQLRMIRVEEAVVRALRGDLDAAEADLTALLAEGPLHGRDITQGMAFAMRATTRRRAGDLEGAVADDRAAIAIFEVADEDAGAAEAYAGLARTEAARGELAAARGALELAVARLQRTPPGLAVTSPPFVHEAAAAVALASGDASRALLHLGRATALRDSLGATLVAGERHDVERIEAAARDRIGDTEADRELAAGRDRTGLLPPID